MDRALLLTLRFHDGRYHGAGDWPPAPARLYQAIVAGAARGRHIPDTEAEALQWLEHQDPPEIAAPDARAGAAPKLYVPNNDLDAVGGDPRRVNEIRTEKRTRLRLFNAAVPILYAWRVAAPIPPALLDLADRLYRLGRGEDAAWAVAEDCAWEEAAAKLAAHPGLHHRPGPRGSVPAPGPGTLESLIARHRATLDRFSWTRAGRSRVQVFAQPPKPRLRAVGYDLPPRRYHFELRAEEGTGYAAMPLHGAGPLVDGLRKAAADRLARHGVAEAERLIVGRGAGAADKERRVRIVPLPSIGHREADPSIRRLLLEVPQRCPIPAEDIAWAFAGLSPCDPETGEILASATLVGSEDAAMSRRYLGPARRWQSVTALALPQAARRRMDPTARGGKKGSERAGEEVEAVRAVRRALAHVDLRHQPVAIAVQREPFGRREAMAALFHERTRFRKHTLWHLDLTFDRPVAGPLLLGDGRFTGLGLMRPVTEVPGAWQLRADPALPNRPEALARALRRAVMARVQQEIGRSDLPAYFHGHEHDGTALSLGDRHHLAFAADPEQERLLILAPHLADRRAPTVEERRHIRLLERALSSLTTLRAGSCGAFDLSARPMSEDDRVLGYAASWSTLTEYRLTRHPRRISPVAAASEDVVAECRRRRLPPPEVEVLKRSGGLTFHLGLTFPQPVSGPLLLGRTAMLGGGLFTRTD